MQNEIAQVIAKFQAEYPDITLESMMEIAQYAKVKVLEVGEPLVKLGQTYANVAYILKGLVKSYYINHVGDEVIYNFEEEGKISGNWYGTLLQKPALICVEAIEPSIIAEVDIKILNDFAGRDIPIANAYRKVLKEMLGRLLLKVTCYTNEKPEARYIRFLDEYSNIVNRISQKQLASYLGITPVSLSRIKSRVR